MEENVRRDVYRLVGPNSTDNPDIGQDRGRFRQVQSEVDRFWSKVKLSRQGCWTWTGRRNRWGYGLFDRSPFRGLKRLVLAHRLAYEMLRGDIPDGLTLDHLCNNPACVRPSHLEPVTNSENLRRRHARRRTQNGATQ